METLPPLTVVLADEHAIVREGIASFFKTNPGLSIVGQCGDGETAVAMILDLQPDFAFLDLRMPKISGLDVVRQVRQTDCPTKLMVLSVSRDDAAIRELFVAGANAYILKDGPARHLAEAIHFVLDGGRYLTPLLRREAIENTDEKDPLTLLSKREFEVFSFLVDGVRPKDIARALELSPKTVDTYRANIMRKLEVEGIAGLVKFAIQRNLTSQGTAAR